MCSHCHKLVLQIKLVAYNCKIKQIVETPYMCNIYVCIGKWSLGFAADKILPSTSDSLQPVAYVGMTLYVWECIFVPLKRRLGDKFLAAYKDTHLYFPIGK